MRVFARYVVAISTVWGVAMLAGCASSRPQSSPEGARAPDVAEVAPARFGPAPAKIQSINSQFKFVVIDFRSRAMAPVGTQLTVYRDGQRVGAVRITEPVRAQFATADIIEGELQVGDEAR
jgi:hypothetical protein